MRLSTFCGLHRDTEQKVTRGFIKYSFFTEALFWRPYHVTRITVDLL
jgi:hypothetical protein